MDTFMDNLTYLHVYLLTELRAIYAIISAAAPSSTMCV